MKIFVCVLVTCSIAFPAGSEDMPQSAAPIFRLMARQIQDCPNALYRETRWGKKPNEIERAYFKPPTNVVWDIVPSKTPVRSPFEGYVEFSAVYFEWVPPEA